MVYVNEDVKKTNRVFPMQDRYGFYRYDMNENPEGLPKEFVDDVVKNITPEFLSIYPEPNKFIEKYAKFINVNSNMVIPTNGSDRAIRTILETFGSKNKEVLTVTPTFEMYWVNCSILGLKHKAITFEKDFSLDVQKVYDAINENTGIVVLLNPNSPIGYIYSDEEVDRIIAKARKYNALVVIDEAYYYFYDKTFVNKVNEYDNVLVLRTFSKMFSLASLRLGVIIGNEHLIEMLNHGRLTFDVNSVALLFGEKIIERQDIIDNLIKTQQEGKEYLINNLTQQGYECIDCRGNYVLLKTKHDSHMVAKKLKEDKKVLVHDYNNELLRDYLRVTTGSIKAMKFFVDCLLSVENSL